jgi:hypothetical protein
MRHSSSIAAAIIIAVAVLANAGARAADSGPTIVVPGRPDVPVIINGVDVRWGVVEGDWGLYKPAIIDPRIIYAPLQPPPRPEDPGYYPAFGHKPGYGRHEVEPPANRRLPPPAQSYHRFWGSASDPLPASIDPPVPVPMLVMPQITPGRRHFGHTPPYTPPNQP